MRLPQSELESFVWNHPNIDLSSEVEACLRSSLSQLWCWSGEICPGPTKSNEKGIPPWVHEVPRDSQCSGSGSNVNKFKTKFFFRVLGTTTLTGGTLLCWISFLATQQHLVKMTNKGLFSHSFVQSLSVPWRWPGSTSCPSLEAIVAFVLESAFFLS